MSCPLWQDGEFARGFCWVQCTPTMDPTAPTAYSCTCPGYTSVSRLRASVANILGPDAVADEYMDGGAPCVHTYTAAWLALHCPDGPVPGTAAGAPSAGTPGTASPQPNLSAGGAPGTASLQPNPSAASAAPGTAAGAPGTNPSAPGDPAPQPIAGGIGVHER